MELTPDLLALVAGVILSLAFSYVPGLNTKFAVLDPIYKRLIMLVLLLITAGGVYGLSCAGLLSYVTCDQGGAWLLLGIFIRAAVANQSAYLLSPEAPSVFAARLEHYEQLVG